MNSRRKGSNSRVKDFQIEGPWIPVTPVKPSSTEQQQIYADREANQPSQANWPELKSFSTGISQESRAHGVGACCGSTDSVDINRGFDSWEKDLATNHAVYSENGSIYKFSMDFAEKLNNMPFADLLALADAASTANTTSSNAAAQADVNGKSSSFISIFGSQTEENRFETSSIADHDASLGSNYQINGNCAPNVHQNGHSIPSRPSFDLNSPPRTTSDGVLSKGLSSQFAPVTPDQSKSIGKKQVSDVPNLSMDEGTNQAREKVENEVTTKRVEVNELHHEKEQSPMLQDQSCTAVSTELQENHNPDKGGNEGTDLDKTPQQKPRRRKHRPKVVIEGQPKRTRKPRTPKPADPNETPRVKRKYVRRKALNTPTDTPPAEVTSGTTDPKTAGTTTKSCRRSLNFDSDSQVRDESSSCRPPSNFDLESHAQNFYTRVQSTMQLGQGMDVTLEKTQVSTDYDLTRSMNQVLESYLSMPERQAPSPSTASKTDLSHDEAMADAQNACTRGKCRIVFSDEAHDKEANTVQLKNGNAQSAPRSLNFSNSSSSACLTKEKQARGSKREHSCLVDETDLCSVNSIGTHYNSLQAYLEMFPANEYNNDRIPGLHFPAIYKKKRTEKGHNSAISSTLSTVNSAQNPARQTMAYPLKATDADPCTSETNCRFSAAQFTGSSASTKITEACGAQDKQYTFKCMLTLGHTERLKKKRSKGPTRVRDLASLLGILEQLRTSSVREATASGVMQPHTCMEALVADTRATKATKKRTKRNSIVCSVPPNIYNHHQFLTKSMGTPPGIIWKGMSSIDALVEWFKRLDINVESNQIADQEQNALIPYDMRYQEQNALVLYKRDGTVVPFEGSFNLVKKRQPRPKVDLDDETNKVWKLLLEDINSQGINGTDEEKAKWWEEERRVFRGRADSFIARMHLVQGDRRFSQWKGSVVDSVVGVFLTQNVSDHLSSSAFMSVAARFPLKSMRDRGPPHEERTNTLDPEDIIGWHEEKSNQPACDQSSMTLQDVEYNEEKEVVNSNESFGSSTGDIRSKDNSKCNLGLYHELAVNNRSATQMTETVASFLGDQRETEDVLSSQNSVISSQNSLDSPIAPTADRIQSCLPSKSEAELIARSKSNSFGGSTSFVELLQMAGTTMLHGVYNQESANTSSNKKVGKNKLEGLTCGSREQNKDRSDAPNATLGAMIPSGNYQSQMTPNSGVLDDESFYMLREESRFSDIPKKYEENSMSEQSGLSAESASEDMVQKITTVSSQEAPKSSNENKHPCNNAQAEVNKIFMSQRRTFEDPVNNVKSQIQENICKVQQGIDVPNFSGETFDVTESTSITENCREHKAKESNLNDYDYLLRKTANGTNVNTSKAKGGRTGKEKQNVDWDSLRKQAQDNGKRRERTANTMDSLDWEAVRCADVNEIANTIRERGMNNMLAERIKDFLNRIVRDHGSIDLEWLRDVPPDKAKEYLLSIRGLGLKSVECVRLLTLHHLAFPVDTNVGRIAVRLGWVPLQPLPESLQLHLLELYPVLESIQKFLWPRLCKLDQRTLYELHYQMITFGKVFCTKSKPNCNACPMRGECRHFASAFASARLALPAPDDKRIVSATENNAAYQSPVGIANRLQLPPSQANQHLELNSEVRICEPIIEVPATPEPIIEVPATPELEQAQIQEGDIEDNYYEDPDKIPTIKLNIEEFTQNLQNYMQQNMELQEGDMSKAMVALTPEVASIPMPKLKNVSRLRTEHRVYELPDSHPLLEGLDKREPDDPCSYLLAIWTPGETAESIQPPESRCGSQECGKLCDEETCFSCSSIREANSQTVRGTLLIPCRTAMRGSFPLNGTYFQVNEVFADHDSSLNPIDVPTSWIWNLPRRTVYFGTSIPTIFKGLSTEGIQYCFWRGFVCVRGFDQKMRAPRPLMARLHFPASKLTRTRGKIDEN